VKKMIVMAVVGLVALAVLGVGGLFAYRMFFAKPKPAAPAADAAKEPPKEENYLSKPLETGGGGEEGGGGPAVMVISGLIVNLNSPQHRNAFLKCEVNILFADPDLGKLAVSDKPSPEKAFIKQVVLDAVSGKSPEEAADPETRDAVRQEIKSKLNEMFANHRSKEALQKAAKTGKPLPPPIMDVLITDWAIQQ